MSERINVPKAVRFEVFKRDGFTCQYCGRQAPEVVLNCDHIHPVAEGGTNDVLNLITSCFDCNSGKGARTLDERHILNKQRSQLDSLNERRVQLEMLADWQRQLSDLGDYRLSILEKRWEEIHEGPFSLTQHGRDSIRKWLKRFSEQEIMEAMVASFETYVTRDEEGQATADSLGKAFDFVPRVAAVRKSEADKPHLKKLYYIRGILRNRLRYIRDPDCLELMEEAVQCDIDLVWLEGFAKRVSSWSAFRRSLEQFIEEQSGR